MSSYNTVNQWLEEMGASSRSADDPWTITRDSQRMASGSWFSPAVEADLGDPAQDLTSQMQSAEQIAQADEVVTSPAGSSTKSSSGSSSSGILGGFLDLFPLASMVGKLFGLGGSSSPPPPTPYIAPPSVNFEGALSSSLLGSTASTLSGISSPSISQPESSNSFAPGIGSLSYGENGMPRTASSPDLMGQLTSLTGSQFTPEPASSNPISTADLAATTSVPSPASSISPGSTGTSAVASQNSQTGTQASSAGQSILVQVQAMDSQSFMDHSSDIAQAVRQAMLNSHSVNDVIADL